MITYTKNTDAVNEGLYDIIQAEFKPIPVLFESAYSANMPSECIVIWLEESRWLSNHSEGETREYEYSIKHLKTFDKEMDRNTLKLEFTNYGERLLQLLNTNRSYGSTTWHHLTAELNVAGLVEDEENVYMNELMVTITRSNFW